MNGLDLFSGIGGITKALEGYVSPVAYCENDRYAQAVLLSRFTTGELPPAPIWDDVRTLRGSMLPHIDIIYGGFPCQDISVAGRGAGLDGKRSGLFFEIARLVSEIRPQFVFLENVSAITVRGAERVVGELCRLRYDCRWGVLSAADVGANHRRERWWLLAHAMPSGERGDQRQSEVEGDAEANSAGDGRREVGSREPSASSEISYAQSDKRRRSRRDGQPLLHGEESNMVDAAGAGLEGRSRPEAPWSPCGESASGDKPVGRRNAQSDIRGMVDGLPEELDGFGIMGRHVEEKIDASHRMGSKGSQESGFERVLRKLFEEIVARFAPHGWESEEQFIKEFALALRQLPHALTLDQRKASVATTQALLFGLRQALKALGALRDSSKPCYAAWQSLSEAEKDWAFMAARFGIFHQEWPGVPRVASGVTFRVDRLRALGNAVVPQQAREAFERLMGLK